MCRLKALVSVGLYKVIVCVLKVCGDDAVTQR